MDERIAELERAAAGHWRGTEEEWLGGWLLRAAGGFTGRANSALAVANPGMPLGDALAAVTGWYDARGLPPMVAVPLPLDDHADGPRKRARPARDAGAGEPATGRWLDRRLAERGWTLRTGSAFVMIADAASGEAASGEAASGEAASGAAARAVIPPALPPDLRLRMDAEPDASWLGMYHYRGQDVLPAVARHLLVSAPWQSFASIRSDDGDAIAIARLSVGGGWAGITAVEVAGSARRRGLGTAITGAVRAAAATRGARRVFLQVETGNMGARALYERCGFRYSHRYQYRIAPT